MKKFLRETILISTAISLAGLWQYNRTVTYTVPLLSFFIFIYIVINLYKKMRNKKTFAFHGISDSFDILILNFATIVFVYYTGSIYSPIFFLLYFLCFGIAFIFSPIMAILFAIEIVIVLLPDALKNYAIESFIKLGSIILISPLAYFFGKEYLKKENKHSG